ncbi:hypothetical protein TVAG_072060 [Trichomonas vaginalis G3]|uniref:RNA polymerase II assembly factor Rtp1 C-terminal domain-containing protein n=1 Tax=Trichomonas vaginalis (strain ATCC PRA-98 / G3) TaxID=412133 RepID=A2D8B0_TRIV3|nr:transport and Golgi organization protein 6 family member family [Trichomonas vaginalis G3]EAY23543.1 hypothetical protein TVAG_072060 [Trichomonas vaginalis G3]KAI5493965.1 transport and Golgi organization protein 6 family member family [Trichomonas vaginalis G3]|eukprot:XP_001584529.1 hypothetical protein [Trichomonas vaginalis G3]
MSCWLIDSQIVSMKNGKLESANKYKYTDESIIFHKAVYETLQPLISKYLDHSLTSEDINIAITKLEALNTQNDTSKLIKQVFWFLNSLNHKDNLISVKELVDAFYKNDSNNEKIVNMLINLFSFETEGKTEEELIKNFNTFKIQYLSNGGTDNVLDIFQKVYIHLLDHDVFIEELLKLQNSNKLSDLDNKFAKIMVNSNFILNDNSLFTIIMNLAMSNQPITIKLISKFSNAFPIPTIIQNSKQLMMLLLHDRCEDFISNYYSLTNDSSYEFLFSILLKFIFSTQNITFDKDNSMISVITRRYCQSISGSEELIDYIGTYSNLITAAFTIDASSQKDESLNEYIELIFKTFHSKPVIFTDLVMKLNEEFTLKLSPQTTQTIILHLLKFNNFPFQKLNIKILSRLIDVIIPQIEACKDSSISTALNSFYAKLKDARTLAGIQPQFLNLVDLLMVKIRPTTQISEATKQIPKFIQEIELTGDVYADLSHYCAHVIKNYLPSSGDLSARHYRAICFLIVCIINWGIYPHLPKSIQIPFEDLEHWVLSPAPPRLNKPANYYFEALESFFDNVTCQDIHPMFLQHVLACLHFLDLNMMNKIMSTQNTEVLFSSILSLIPLKINITSLLPDIILNRSDSLSAIQNTIFPLPMLAKAIGTPPSLDKQDDYYKKLFPKLLEAIRSGNGDKLSKEIIKYIVSTRSEQFLKHVDLEPLIEWPTTNEKPLGTLLWTLESVLSPKSAQKILVSPMPHRILFLAAQTEGEINKRCLNLLKFILVDEKSVVDFVKVVVSDSSLSPLGLDSFVVDVSQNQGVSVVETEPDEIRELTIITKMREIVSKLIKIEYMDSIISCLPGTFGSVQLISQILPTVQKISPDWGIPLLSFLSRVKGDAEIGMDIVSIAKAVFDGLEVDELPRNVINTFGGDIPEMLSMKYKDEDNDSDDNDKTDIIKSISNDLQSPIAALRGRGLFDLRRNVMDKKSVLRDEENIKKILPLAENQLKHEESYVYINAIRCLESIGDVFPHLVVKKLCEEYPKPDVSLSLKVAQTLMLLARRTGPGLIHSANGNLCGHFIKAFSRGVSHESTLIQAASLSDMAEFVSALEFGCANWLTDIVLTIDNAWQQHHVVDVRRAASYCCYRIILVLGEGFGECSPENVKLLGRIVKRNREAELDDVAHQNAEDCYQTMWDCAASFL